MSLGKSFISSCLRSPRSSPDILLGVPTVRPPVFFRFGLVVIAFMFCVIMRVAGVAEVFCKECGR